MNEKTHVFTLLPIESRSARFFTQDQLNEAVAVALTMSIANLGLGQAAGRGFPAGAGSSNGGSWGSTINSSAVGATPSTPSLVGFVSGDEGTGPVTHDDKVLPSDQV